VVDPRTDRPSRVVLTVLLAGMVGVGLVAFGGVRLASGIPLDVWHPLTSVVHQP